MENGIPTIEPQYLEYVDPSANQLQLSIDLRNQTAMYDVCHRSSYSNPTDGKSPIALVISELATGIIITLLFVSLMLAGYQSLWHIRSGKRSKGQRSSPMAPSHRKWYWRLLDPVMQLTRRHPGHRKDEYLAPLIPLIEVTDEGYGSSRLTPADMETRWWTTD